MSSPQYAKTAAPLPNEEAPQQLPPPQPVMAWEAPHTEQPPQQNAQIGFVPDANLRAGPVPSDVAQRQKWRKVAIITLVMAAVFFYFGVRNLQIRHEGGPGACCLPRGCDVTKLQDYRMDRYRNSSLTANSTVWENLTHSLHNDVSVLWDGPSGGESDDMCIFSPEEIAVMGCATQFAQVHAGQCQLVPLPEDEDHHHHDEEKEYNPMHGHCDRNHAVTKMTGTGIPLLVMGALTLFLSLALFFPGYSCYGAVEDKKTCWNWIARLFTVFVWILIWSGAIVGLVFGSMSVRALNDQQFFTEQTCHTEDGSATCDLDTHSGLMWGGANCSVANEPAEVFSWIRPTNMQKLTAGVSVLVCVAFIILTCALIIRKCIKCCQGCNKQHQQQNDTTAPTATATVEIAPQPNANPYQAPQQHYNPQYQQPVVATPVYYYGATDANEQQREGEVIGVVTIPHEDESVVKNPVKTFN